MKKIIIFAVCAVFTLAFISCEPESEDPPVFDNGLMVTLGQNPINSGGIVSNKDFTARSFVGCEYEVTAVGEKYTFTAKTAQDELWTVKFKYDPETDDSLVYIDEDVVNTITLKSTVVGDYYISSDSDNADQTVIKLLRLVPNEIIEAEFEGFIFKSGSPAVPDTLKEGYFITKTRRPCPEARC
jgi:hypothetical protein